MVILPLSLLKAMVCCSPYVLVILSLLYVITPFSLWHRITSVHAVSLASSRSYLEKEGKVLTCSRGSGELDSFGQENTFFIFLCLFLSSAENGSTSTASNDQNRPSFEVSCQLLLSLTAPLLCCTAGLSVEHAFGCVQTWLVHAFWGKKWYFWMQTCIWISSMLTT